MPPYPYQRLEDGQIRLIVLSWTLEDESLTASLITVQLDDSDDQYHALSYVWGSEEKPRVLRIGGTDQIISITESAYLALDRLRLNFALPAQPFIVWIDAICINQADDQEKNQQVTMMANIYAHASKVYAYLGEEADHSHEALNILKELRTKHRDLFLTLKDVVRSRFPRWADIPKPERLLAAALAFEGVLERASHLAGLLAFLSRSWFDRVWIVREVLVARGIDLICGQQTLSLDDLIFGFMVI
jgi:hypothetical protein